MLTALYLKNFKSFGEARLPLAPLTMLIGANAAGKSNAIEGLRLLSWLAQGLKLSSLQHSLPGTELVLRGRPGDLCFRGATSFTLGCELEPLDWNTLKIELGMRDRELHIINEKITSAAAVGPLYQVVRSSGGKSSDVEVAYNNFQRGPNKPRVRCSDQTAIFTQLDSAASFNAQDTMAQDAIPMVVAHYAHYLADITFLDPVPAKMRSYSFATDSSLLADGSNLSSTLFMLWGKDEDLEAHREQRAEILDFIQSLPEQEISGLEFLETPRGEVMVQLVETFGSERRSYDASLLSDGTLRVLAIAATMLSTRPDNVVVIEEIDNGVHPSRARHLLGCIQKIAEKRRLSVLLSTHNPAMLDALPDNAVSDVVFCYRDPSTGASKLVKMSDIPDVPELLVQGTLGHLVTTGAFERFVKNYPGKEVKRQKAQEWLAALRATSAEPGA